MSKVKKGVRLEKVSKIYQDPKTKKEFKAVLFFFAKWRYFVALYVGSLEKRLYLSFFFFGIFKKHHFKRDTRNRSLTTLPRLVLPKFLVVVNECKIRIMQLRQRWDNGSQQQVTILLV